MIKKTKKGKEPSESVHSSKSPKSRSNKADEMDGSFGLNESLKAGGGLRSPSNKSRQSEKSHTTKGSKAAKETKQPNQPNIKAQAEVKPTKAVSKGAPSVASAADTVPKKVGPSARSDPRQRSTSKVKKTSAKKEKVATQVEIKADVDTKFKFINSAMIEKLMDMCCDQLDAKLLDLASLIEKNRDNLRWVSHKVREAEAELKDPLVNSDIPLFKDDFRFFGQLVRSRLAASVMRRNQAQMDKEMSSPQKTIKQSTSQLASSQKKGTTSKGSPLRSHGFGNRSRSKSRSATKKVVYLPAGQAAWALVHRTPAIGDSHSREQEFHHPTDSPAISPWETASKLLYRRSSKDDPDSEWLRWEQNSPEQTSPAKRITKIKNGKSLHEEIDPMIDTLIVGESFKNYTPEELQVKFPKPRGTKAQEVRDQKNKDRLTKVLASFRKEQELREGRSRSRSRSQSLKRSRSGSLHSRGHTQSPPKGVSKNDPASPKSTKRKDTTNIPSKPGDAKENLKRRKIKNNSKDSLNDSASKPTPVEKGSRSTSRSNSSPRHDPKQKEINKTVVSSKKGDSGPKTMDRSGRQAVQPQAQPKDRNRTPVVPSKAPVPKVQTPKPEPKATTKTAQKIGRPLSPASERNVSPSLASRGASREGSARDRLNRTVTEYPSKLSQSISDIDPKEKFSGKKPAAGSPSKPSVSPIRTKVISPSKPTAEPSSKRPAQAQPGITKISLAPLDLDRSRDKTPGAANKKPAVQPVPQKTTKPEIAAVKISASSPPPSKVGKPAPAVVSKPVKAVSPSPLPGPKKPDQPKSIAAAPANRADKSPAPAAKQPDRKPVVASPPPAKKEPVQVNRPVPAAKVSGSEKAPSDSGKKDPKSAKTPVTHAAKKPPEASPSRRRIEDSSRRPGSKVS